MRDAPGLSAPAEARPTLAGLSAPREACRAPSPPAPASPARVAPGPAANPASPPAALTAQGQNPVPVSSALRMPRQPATSARPRVPPQARPGVPSVAMRVKGPMHPGRPRARAHARLARTLHAKAARRTSVPPAQSLIPTPLHAPRGRQAPAGSPSHRSEARANRLQAHAPSPGPAAPPSPASRASPAANAPAAPRAARDAARRLPNARGKMLAGWPLLEKKATLPNPCPLRQFKYATRIFSQTATFRLQFAICLF